MSGQSDSLALLTEIKGIVFNPAAKVPMKFPKNANHQHISASVTTDVIEHSGVLLAKTVKVKSILRKNSRDQGV
jgi:hypothetical protein